MKSKNKLAKIKDSECLNCKCPFNGQEKFCPDCGQKNIGNSITFKSFIHEVFNGLFSLDGKFWNTLIPLLTRPGVISRNYIDGKRQRYSNPFRFYLTVSILFFLILGLSKSINKFEELKDGVLKDKSSSISYNYDDEIKKNNKDSLKIEARAAFENSLISLDSTKRKETLNQIPSISTMYSYFFDEAEEANDSIIVSAKNKTEKKQFNKITEYLQFQKKYPEINIDDALDSLNFPKDFENRFLYERSKTIRQVFKDRDSIDKFSNQALSYGSVSLFIFLPFFTLFLRLFYIRRKYTYVDHLIFVFHTQTIFFIILTLVIILSLFANTEGLWIFIFLFLAYLFLAMKKFYQQGYLKTFVKFLMLNFVYLIFGILGVFFVTLISFAIY